MCILPVYEWAWVSKKMAALCDCTTSTTFCLCIKFCIYVNKCCQFCQSLNQNPHVYLMLNWNIFRLVGLSLHTHTNPHTHISNKYNFYVIEWKAHWKRRTYACLHAAAATAAVLLLFFISRSFACINFQLLYNENVQKLIAKALKCLKCIV